MSILQAATLGLVQGLSEFLPISSSGHLVIFQDLLGLLDNSEKGYLLFNILLHIGTLLSVLIVFHKDVFGMVPEFFLLLGDLCKGKVNMDKSPYRRMLIMLIVASTPLIIGALLENRVELLFSSPLFVGCALLFTGLILILTDKMIGGLKNEYTQKFGSAVTVGLFQLIAVLPGISRSGSTIFAGALSGLDKKYAVKFSFLLSAIAILGATAFSAKDLIGGASLSVPLIPCLVGIAVSAVSGIFAIRLLNRLLLSSRYSYFAYYCWIVGAVTIAVSLIRG